MEGIYWIRLAAIAAMFLGSIYVLLPTVLQEDFEERLASAASEVEAPTTAQGAVLEVDFTVEEGAAEELLPRLSKRLEAAGVPVARVAVEGTDLRVVMGAGASRDEVVRLAARAGTSSLVLLPLPEPTDAVPEPAEGSALPDEVARRLGAVGVDLEVWGELLAQVALEAPPLAATSVDARITGATQGEEGAVSLALEGSLPLDPGVALVVVDERVVGVALPVEGGVAYEALARALPGGDPLMDNDAVALLASGPLGGRLRAVPVEEAPDAAPEATQAAAPTSSGPPAWLVGLLPDTRMNLGLDLQGGIDLTLQVGLEDAVLAQATRDLTYLKDQAAKEGVIIEGVRRERSLPMLWLTTDAELGDVQKFMRQRLPDYVYTESEGNKHAFEMQTERQEEVQSSAVEQVLETLRKRVDATGVKEPSIVKKGGGRINVQLPGMVDLQAAVDAIGTTAVLEFRLVDEEFDPSVLEQILLAAEKAMPAEQYADDNLLNDWLWDNKRLAEDRLVLWQYEDLVDGATERSFPYALKNEVILTGNDVNDAGVAWDQNQMPYVSLEFKPRGGQVFCEVTGKNVQKRFGIILDNQVMSAPSIRERICGGAARIDMGSASDPMKESQTLALVLRTGSLDAPVVVGEVRTVGSTLGQDSIKAGSIAAVVGSLVVLLFMAAWYRTSGLIADIALTVNILLVLGGLALFGATLTLPGIAGIALTVGMAVDANIIIYERIREELKLGVVPRKAVDVGFEKAVVAVLDANITTAIAGIVLFSYGTGPIKGFAVTLLIGIATTLITALFVTRTLMDVATRSSTVRLRI